MGTRGAVGFRFQEQDKLQYNHWDSYPTGLGCDVVELVQKFNDEQLAGAAARIVMIDPDVEPTPELIKRYEPWTNLGVSEQRATDWYCLLREAQGQLDLYVDGSIDHMFPGSDFMADSLFCEWAYVINMDERVLEIYKGFNKDPEAPGRYAHLKDDEYHGVTLLATLPLADVRAITDAKAAMTLIEESAYPEEE